MENMKTEEAKLREEIEKIEKRGKRICDVENRNYSKEIQESLYEDWLMAHPKWEILKAKLQQLLADKKMFKDAVEELKKKNVKGVDNTCKKLVLHELLEEFELVKAGGIQEED